MLLDSTGLLARKRFHSIRWMKYSPLNNSDSVLWRPLAASLILRQGLAVLIPGIAIGIAASAWVTGLLKSQLYAVSPLDPGVYATVGAILTVVALAASLVPVRRAMRVDPVIALRHD